MLNRNAPFYVKKLKMKYLISRHLKPVFHFTISFAAPRSITLKQHFQFTFYTLLWFSISPFNIRASRPEVGQNVQNVCRAMSVTDRYFKACIGGGICWVLVLLGTWLQVSRKKEYKGQAMGTAIVGKSKSGKRNCEWCLQVVVFTSPKTNKTHKCFQGNSLYFRDALVQKLFCCGLQHVHILSSYLHLKNDRELRIIDCYKFHLYMLTPSTEADFHEGMFQKNKYRVLIKIVTY
jgi:hypothetical protein